MIRVLVVGDGPRDEAMVPAIVATVLGRPVEAQFEPWARLHDRSGKGYGRKLRYAIAVARDRRRALVATLDVDASPRRERMAELQQARDDARSRPDPVPTALGAANPHGEAWLLDDAVAVRSVLGLAADVPVPSVLRVRSPKGALEALMAESPRAGDRPRDVWRHIAVQVRP